MINKKTISLKLNIDSKFYERNKIIAVVVLSSLLIFNSCNGEKKSKIEDDSINYLKSEIDKSLQIDNDKVETLELLKTDSLNEYNIASYVDNNNFAEIKMLLKKQNKLGQEIPEAKRNNKLEELKIRFDQISDSLKYYQKISEKIYSTKPDSLKIEYYEFKFLLKTLNSAKKDTVYFYSTKAKRKQFIPENELINHIIIEKYKVK